MSKLTKGTTAAIWLLRALQFAFGVILLGATGYLARQSRHTDVGASRRVILPLIISAIAIVEVILYFITAIFKLLPVFLIFAFFDFCIWVVYLAAAGVLRKNFNGPPLDNDLAPYLINARRRAGLPSHSGRIQNLVRLVAGLVIIQIIFYFFTMLLTAYRAYRSKRSVTPGGDREKMGFNRMRNSDDNSHINAAGPATAGVIPNVGEQHQTNLNAPTGPSAGSAVMPNGGHMAGAAQGGQRVYTEQERTTNVTMPGTTRGEYV